jgi:hypothetical protein
MLKSGALRSLTVRRYLAGSDGCAWLTSTRHRREPVASADPARLPFRALKTTGVERCDPAAVPGAFEPRRCVYDQRP